MTLLSNLQHFPFDECDIRVAPDPVAPRFVANDVARALGYKDVRYAIQSHCKHGTVSTEEIPDHLGRPQFPVIIPESDVYRLIFRSRLPSAERFADWVFETVLPSIRKTGGYTLDDMTEHGRVVGERMLIENSARWFDKEREYQAEIAELKRLLVEPTTA